MDGKRLKARRTGRLSSFTKRVQKARELLENGSTNSQLLTMKEEVSNLKEECEAANLAYIDTLEEEEMISQAYIWFSDVEENCADILRDIDVHLAKQVIDEESAPAQKPTVALDAWIDMLVPLQETVTDTPDTSEDTSKKFEQLILQTMCERNAPRPTMAPFDGSPLDWPRFVDLFHEEVHRQPFFNDKRRMLMLQECVIGRAKQHIQGYGTDSAAYAVALKALKSRFGHRSLVARAFIQRITDGPVIKDHDRAQLEMFYVNIRDCIFTLRRMNYEADIMNMDTVRRCTCRLPMRLRERWAECCRIIRQSHEPNLEDLEDWLSDRVQALFDPILPEEESNFKGFTSASRTRISSFHTSQSATAPAVPANYSVSTSPYKRNTSPPCVICSGSHPLFKCEDYLSMTAQRRFQCVNSYRLCRNCLRPGHVAAECSSLGRCRVDDCNKKHHTSLHHVQQEVHGFQRKQPASLNTARRPEESTQKSDKEDHPQRTFSTQIPNSHVYLQVVPVMVMSASGKEVRTSALLDGGSHITMIRGDLADQLDLSGPVEDLRLGTITREEEVRPAQQVNFSVCSASEDGPCYRIQHAWAVEKLNIPPQNSVNFSNLPHLRDLKDVLPDNPDIGLLIGGDVPDVMLQTDFRRGPPGTPIAIKTGLGWTLLGRLADPTVKHNRLHVYHTSLKPFKEESADHLDRFFTTESFGCKFDGHAATSVEDRIAQTQLDQKTFFESGRYAVPMLWKDEKSFLPSNYAMALKRHQSLCRKLRSDPLRFQRYSDTIHTWVEKGYARKMSDMEASTQSPITWYLPHHDVYAANTGKTRVVQDCAARYAGTSLNDKLLTGPDLLNCLTSVLLNFRRGSIGLTADIESMFHRVFCLEADIDCLRFLWSDDLHFENPDTYQMCVHTFGAKSSPTCANYALRRTATDRAESFSNLAVETVLRNFYMDDLCTSQPSVDGAISLSKEVTELLNNGGFRLTKWKSNSKDLLASLPASEVAIKDFDLSMDDMPTQRVLGCMWDINEDVITFRSLQPDAPATKRGIIRTIATLFDPCGLCGPFVLTAKQLMQMLWKREIGWDDEVPEDLLSIWQSWLTDLPNITGIRVPRCYSPDLWEAPTVEIHVFCDGSEIAFGCVAYLRIMSANGTISIAFLLSKTRIAPVKKLTMPRLELQAAVLAARIYVKLKEELQFDSTKAIFWTDSMSTLGYIKNTSRRFNRFTANRQEEILDATSADWWRYIPTLLNPADDCTRPVRAADLSRPGHRFISGPDFLQKPEAEWPEQIQVPATPLNDPEVIQVKHFVATTQEVSTENSPIDPRRYSRLTHLIRVTAWVLRFVRNMKSSMLPRHNKTLTAEELEESLLYWVKVAQLQEFPREIAALTQGRLVSSSSPLRYLQPTLVDGILRVGGRLHRAAISYDARHQVVMSQNHYVSYLLVVDAHEKTAHAGQEAVLSYIRQRFWIVKARVLVRRITRSCVICIRRRAMPVVPQMSPLPESRLAMNAPCFHNTGVDLCGHFFVRRGRTREKRWICLFTCLTTRALHLELVNSLDTDAFILALKRFSSRRGCPASISCDNATNFRGAARELSESIAAMDHAKLSDSLSLQGIQWRFNPPSSPHFGGSWERLVGCVKRTLNVIIGTDHSYYEDVLHTAIIETEAIINSRPLTAVSDDPNDLNALTPNHFLIGRADPRPPPGPLIDINHRKRWRVAQNLLTHLWDRFRKEYIPELTKRHKWFTGGRNLQANDLVLMTDENTPRKHWTLGRIVRPIPGRDGKVRVAEIQTVNGKLIRPVVKLCLLEASSIC